MGYFWEIKSISIFSLTDYFGRGDIYWVITTNDPPH